MTNFLGMMKQAQELQSKMQEMQASLAQLEVEGTSGGGLVKVVLDGKGALRRTAIDPSLMVAEETEILEDLLVAAHTDAKSKLDAALADRMKELTGGMALPPGLGFGM